MIKTALLLSFALSIGETFPSPYLHFEINPDDSLLGKNHF